MKTNRLGLSCIALILSIISAIGCSAPLATGETVANISSSTVDGKDGNWYMPAADTYEFPFTPEKEPEKWKAVDSKVRHDRQNLPEDLLKTISTAGLAESCMNNEFFLDFSFFSPFYYEGAIILFENLNSGRELYTREDAATELIRLYKSINIDALFSKVRSGMFKLDYLEFIISSEKFIQQMTKAQRIDLLSAVLANAKSTDSLEPVMVHYISDALLLGRLLEKESPDFQKRFADDVKVMSFLSTGGMGEMTLGLDFRELISQCEEFIH